MSEPHEPTARPAVTPQAGSDAAVEPSGGSGEPRTAGEHDPAAHLSSAPELQAPLGPSDDAAAPLPSAAPPPDEGEFLSSLRTRLKEREKPTHLGIRAAIFAVSLAAFVWFLRDTGPLGVAVVVGVLAFHEAGHFAAMKLFGYENMKVFFVPFLGAAVAGRARRPGGWRAGVVSLAGPVPGVLLGAGLVAAAPDVPLARLVAAVLLTINGLNLLPFLPLDGGRVLGATLFSRHRLLEFAGTVVGMIGIVAVPDLLPGPRAVWAGLLGGMLFQRLRAIDAAHALRASPYAFEGATSALPADTLVALHGASTKLLQNTVHSEGTITSTMASLHEEAATRPAAWGPALLILTVWGGALGLAWTSWSELKHPTEHWQAVAGPMQRWTLSFPAKPADLPTGPTPPGLKLLRSQAARLGAATEFGVVTVVVDAPLRLEADREDALRRMHAMVAESERHTGLKALGSAEESYGAFPALRTTLQRTGVTIEARYVAFGDTFVVLTTVGASAEAQQRFFSSLRPGPP